jgi:hypothetical protein
MEFSEDLNACILRLYLLLVAIYEKLHVISGIIRENFGILVEWSSFQGSDKLFLIILHQRDVNFDQRTTGCDILDKFICKRDLVDKINLCRLLCILLQQTAKHPQHRRAKAQSALCVVHLRHLEGSASRVEHFAL